MENKLELPTTKYHKVLNSLSMILIIGSFAYIFLNWAQIPDRVPGHFNGAGEIDRWGSKYELFLCPVFSLFIYLIITFCERHPSVWNTGVEVTKKNQARVFNILKNMIVTMKFIVAGTFAFITLFTAQALPLPALFLPVVMVLLFGSMGYFLLLLYRKK